MNLNVVLDEKGRLRIKGMKMLEDFKSKKKANMNV